MFAAGVTAALIKAADLKPGVSLQPHQLDAAAGVESGRGGKILNWGLGSGKTLGSIAIAERRGGPVLVVTPASLRSNFQSQLRAFVPAARVGDYTVVSYDQFRRDPHGIVDRVRPQTLIADEFHRLRNSGPRAPFEAVRAKVPFVVGLTGSLINNRPEEIVPLVNLAAGQRVFKSEDEFKSRFVAQNIVKPGFFGRVMGAQPGVVETAKNKSELRRELAPHVHRFTGTPEYRQHLPRVVEERVEVVMTPQQEQLYRALSTRNPVLAYKMRNNLPPSKKELKNMNAFMTAARQIMNNPVEYTQRPRPEDVIAASPKFQSMTAHMTERARRDPNYRAVVYSNFLSSGVSPVVTELEARGVRAGVFSGQLNDRERQALVDDLNRGRVRVLGLSPAGGEGLDLKGVREVHLTEEHWNPERAAQAVGRSARYRSHAHLPADEQRVDVRRYVAVHQPTLMNRVFGTRRATSADEWIDARRQEKLRLNQDVISAVREFTGEKTAAGVASVAGAVDTASGRLEPEELGAREALSAVARRRRRTKAAALAGAGGDVGSLAQTPGEAEAQTSAPGVSGRVFAPVDTRERVESRGRPRSSLPMWLQWNAGAKPRGGGGR